MKSINIYKYIRVIRNIYICAYIVFLISELIIISPQYITHGKVLLYRCFPIIGLMIASADIVIMRKNILKKENLFPIFFLAAALLSMLVNYKYDFSSNMKTLLIMALQFYMFYVLGAREAQNEGKMLSVIMNVYIVAWTIPVIISLYQFLIGYGTRLDESFGEWAYHRVGFYDNRLFGIFEDPNFAAVASIFSIVFCIICWRTRKMGLRVWYIIAIMLSWFYIVLSGSRTALLAMVVAFPLVACICIVAWLKKSGRKFLIRIVAGAAVCIGIIAAIIGVKIFTENVAVGLPSAYQQITEDNIEESRTEEISTEEISTGEISTEESNTEESETEESKTEEDGADETVSLERDDVVNSDNISNNRFEIWKGAIAIWKTTPIVGATPRGYIDYAKSAEGNQFTDLFIIEREAAVHNGYIATLLFSGVLGTIVMIAWCAFLMIRIFKFLVFRYGDENYQTVVLLTTIIFVSAVASMTLTMIFFDTMLVDAIFWGATGCALSFTRDDAVR